MAVMALFAALAVGFVTAWTIRGAEAKRERLRADYPSEFVVDLARSVEVDRCLRAILKRAPKPSERPQWLRHALNDLSPEGSPMRKACEPPVTP